MSTKSNNEPDRYLTTEELGALLKRAPQTLRAARVTGQTCPYIRLGNRVLYDVRDVETYLESLKRRSTSDPGPGRVA